MTWPDVAAPNSQGLSTQGFSMGEAPAKAKRGRRRGARAIAVRRATAADGEAIACLHKRVAGEADSGLVLTRHEAPAAVSVAKRIARADQTGRDLVLVAERGGRVVGRLVFRGECRARLAHRGSFSIMVERTQRGSGVGTALIGAMLDWARVGGRVKKITLRVLATNTRARRLYRSLGFVREGVLRKGVRLSQTRYVDEVVMSIWLGGSGRD